MVSERIRACRVGDFGGGGGGWLLSAGRAGRRKIMNLVLEGWF